MSSNNVDSSAAPLDNKAASLQQQQQPQQSTDPNAAPAAAATAAPAVAALPLEIHVVPEYKSIPALECGASYIDVLVEIKSGRPATGQSRTPLNLVLLLDHSGSTAGARLRSLVSAAKQIVEQLQDSDYCTLIAFNDEAKVLASGRGDSVKNPAVQAIEALRAMNATNIEGAMKLAINVLKKTCTTVQGAASRCFLISDGEPTCGECSREGLEKVAEGFAEWPLSTFGVGCDIDPALLQSLSNASGGKYQFVADRRIEEVCNKSFDDLSRLMLTRGQLSLKLLSGMKWAPQSESDIVDGTDVGDFRYLATTRYLTRLSTERFEAGSKTAQIPFLRVEFLGLLPDAPLAPPVVVTALGYITVDHEDTATRSAKDPLVDVLVALRNAGQNLDKIDGLLENNDVAGAISLLKEICSSLEVHVENGNDELAGGMPHVLLRRSQRTLERLQAQGVNAARRARLDLGVQATALRDRVSCCDFASSDSGNRSGCFTPTRGAGVGAAAGGNRVGSDGSGTSDDDDLDDDYDDDDDADGSNMPRRRISPRMMLQPTDDSSAMMNAGSGGTTDDMGDRELS